jgi:hypothetical protein
VAILLNTVAISFIMLRQWGELTLVKAFPAMVEQLATRENDKDAELLVSQAVVLRRLKAIERRLEDGTH